MGYSNIKDIVDKLLEKYSYSQVGQIFTESLYQNKTDRVAFEVADDFDNNSRLRNLQKKIITQLKPKLASAFYEHDFSSIEVIKNLPIKNKDSLLGCIKYLLNNKGSEGFEDIGKAVLNGSEEYLKDVPLARIMNADQFKEYNRIKKHIEKAY